MRTNIVLDEELVEQAKSLTGIKTTRALVDRALRVLIQLREQEQVRDLRGGPNWEGDLAALREERVRYEVDELPPEAQRQVMDFIAFLKSRYAAPRRTQSRRRALEDEPFIGMWRDREDIKDSVEWARRFRRSEWGDQQ
jgi:Arc/MetJ family transcription regulator